MSNVATRLLSLILLLQTRPTWKAAELADLSLWEMIDKIRAQKIPVKYDIEDAKEDLRLVFGE